MNCRKFFVLAAVAAFSSSGCLWNSQKTAKVDGSQAAATIPADAVIKRAESLPKKPPSANVIVALAVLRERQADQHKDTDAQTRLRDEARKHYQEALKVDANLLEAQQGLARVYVKLGDYEYAIQTYHKALAKHSNNGGLWLDLAMCHCQRKNYAEGLKAMHKALDTDPQNRHYLKTMGFMLARAGQTEQALSYLTRAAGPAAAHHDLARMMLHMNQPEQARHHLNLALQVNPEYEPARQLLASLTEAGGPAPLATLGTLEVEAPAQ